MTSELDADNQPVDLVIGAAYGYGEDNLECFVRSLRATGYAGKIALVVTKDQARRFANSELLAGIDLMGVPMWRPKIPDVFHMRATTAFWLPFGLLAWVTLQALRFLGDRSVALRLALVGRLFHLWCARHVHYLTYLSRHSFENVMLVDTRDVIFQEDPSAVMRGTSGLSVSVENRSYTIRDEYWNSRWMKTVYGAKTLAEVGGNPVSCAGVSFGTAEAIRNYLELMTAQMLSFRPAALWAGSDQAVHNFLVWTGRLGEVHEMHSLESPIATLNATATDEIRVKSGWLLNHDGSIVGVIHQYDRVPGLAERLTACAESATAGEIGLNTANAAGVHAPKSEG